MEITLLIMENHGIVFMNFCGNPVFKKLGDNNLVFLRSKQKVAIIPFFCVYCRDLEERECIDVTVPLQALVKDSKLISPEKNSKVYLNV